MIDAQSWRQFFAAWPEDLPRSGIVVSTFDEQIPFSGFMVSASFVMLNRRSPDALGARQVILPFSGIAAVKVTDVIKPQLFEQLGFEGTIATK